MNETPCPPGAHIHPVPVPTLVVFRGAQLALDDQLLALCPSEVVANRLAELINQHGLLDVPDHVPSDRHES